MPEQAYICENCGSLNWSLNYSETSYFSRNYSVERDGEVSDDYGESNSGDDSEPTGDNPYCSNCEHTDLRDISDLNRQQLATLYATPQRERMEVIRHLTGEGNEDEEPDYFTPNCRDIKEQRCRRCPSNKKCAYAAPRGWVNQI